MESSLVKPGIKLFSNQELAVRRLARTAKILLSDKTGSGKSVSVLYAYAALRETNKSSLLLILTPQSAYQKQVWKKDMDKFFRFKYMDLEQVMKRIEDNNNDVSFLKHIDVIYGKHTHMASKHLTTIAHILNSSYHSVLCLDEAHAFKNPKTRLTMSCRYCISNAHATWMLTATPLSKNIEDTYNIINLLQPYYLGSFLEFRKTYCSTVEQVIGRGPMGLRKATIITGIKPHMEEAFKNLLAPKVIQGTPSIFLNFHYVDYEMGNTERVIYKRIANGIDLDKEASDDLWLQTVLNQEIEPRPIKDAEKYSSRFLYLQTAADGVLTPRGTQDNIFSNKIDMFVDLVKSIISKGESALVYFDYHASVDAVYARLIQEKVKAQIYKSTGKEPLKEGLVTEGSVKRIPHIILCTRASSESTSYYFINHVVFFHIPTVPSVFVQMAGRITRKNTLFPDDLHCHIFRSGNIDLYKLIRVSSKAYQMELVSGEESNIPNDYKIAETSVDFLQNMKRNLLWRL